MLTPIFLVCTQSQTGFRLSFYLFYSFYCRSRYFFVLINVLASLNAQRAYRDTNPNLPRKLASPFYLDIFILLLNAAKPNVSNPIKSSTETIGI